MKPIIPEAALQQHIAVLGKTGSGKTSTAKLAIEQVVAGGARVCVLDPIKSDWWGLTSSADGKKPGLPFHILGGPRGHVPLHASAGKAIGEVVASGALPLSIIDMADFAPGGQTHFFVDFAPTLIRRMRGVLYLVIEEAHLFAPKERAGHSAENMSIHWAKTLATAGRSKGIRLLLLTQRVQALHNALLGSCETLIAHRLSAPADQDPVLKWLKANASAGILEMVSAQLSSLKTGAGWVCSGEAKIFERMEFPRIKTFDNTATPTGDGDVQEVKQAPVDAEKLRAIVGEAVKEAEANDPKLLRAEIARLKAENARKVPNDAPPASLGAAKAAEYARGRADGWEAGRAEGIGIGHAGVQHRILDALTKMDEISSALRKVAVEAPRKEAHPPAPQVYVKRHTERPQPAPQRAPAGPAAAGSPELGNSGLRRMMIALAQRQGLNRRQLGVRAGLSSRSGTFDTYLSKARTNGWIEGTGDLQITEAGLAALGSYTPLPEGRELLAHWLEELGSSGAARILQALAEAYPGALTREKLGVAANLSDRSGTFDTYLSRLRTLELVTGRGELRASEELFDG